MEGQPSVWSRNLNIRFIGANIQQVQLALKQARQSHLEPPNLFSFEHQFLLFFPATRPVADCVNSLHSHSLNVLPGISDVVFVLIKVRQGN